MAARIPSMIPIPVPEPRVFELDGERWRELNHAEMDVLRAKVPSWQKPPYEFRAHADTVLVRSNVPDFSDYLTQD